MMTEIEEKHVWGVHTQDENLFLKGNVIAIGWHEFGDLKAVEANRIAYKNKYSVVYPNAKKGSIATSSGMLFRFCNEIKIGDYVVFPSKSNRMINIGIITGEYQYVPEAQNNIYDYVQHKKLR